MSTDTKTGSTPVAGSERLPENAEQIVDKVRERYGRIARGPRSGCCGPADDCGATAASADALGYAPDEVDAVPESADLGLGCGAPIQHLALEAGETALDLGSGGGFDALLAAARVGPQGRVIGVDMTPEMIELARRNASAAGAGHVEFRQGRLEALPVADASVDAVTSNCVVNLVPDKAAVFREIARVLRPGGRLVISDIVLDRELPEALARDLLAYVGCVAGAMLRARYFATVEAAGLTEVEVLQDIDFLATVGEALPPEVEALIGRTGVRPEDLAGSVRSVTYRARKR